MLDLDPWFWYALDIGKPIGRIEMNLLEVMDAYQDEVLENGREAGNKWLDGIGLHSEVKKAVIDCFDNNGYAIRTDPEGVQVINFWFA